MVSSDAAEVNASPTRFGREMTAGPLPMFTVTVPPFLTWEPLPGTVLTTLSSDPADERTSRHRPTSPSALNLAWAWLHDWPTRFGTAGPSLAVSFWYTRNPTTALAARSSSTSSQGRMLRRGAGCGCRPGGGAWPRWYAGSTWVAAAGAATAAIIWVACWVSAETPPPRATRS